MRNSKILRESELVLNDDGTIYHLNIRPENVADNIILVGDPGRVGLISSYFDQIEFRGQNREIKTHTGELNNVRLTVMSTGMGADNIDIVLNELDALANIDFKSRKIKKELRSLNIFRLGTSGGLQQDLPLNAFVASEFALGLDGVMNFYTYDYNETELKIRDRFIEFVKWNEKLPTPYCIEPKGNLIDLFGDEPIYKGITITAPGFYGPQGRQLRLSLAVPNLNDVIKDYRFQNKKILNYEMETSALYGLGKLLGHRTLTLCVAIANRYRKEYTQDHQSGIKSLTELLLSRITSGNI